MNQPLLSIAIPTFNRAKKLEKQLTSIHKQISASSHSQNIELLVVDNCSTDSSQDIIQKFSLLDKSYIFSNYRNKKNLGAERNFGQGILRSKGRFTWLLSDDDIIFDEAVHEIFDALNKNKEVGFCFVNFFLDFKGGLPAIKIDTKDMVAKNLRQHISSTMFAESMITACIYRKSLLKEETLTKMDKGPYQYMYWILDILKNHSSCIITTPLFTVAHPGVYESRKSASNREDNLDFYLEAHLDFLKFTSYVYKNSLGLLLRLKIYRLTVNENLNQIIFHKITNDGLGYNFSALKMALPSMIAKFYFSPSFWLIHLPLLLLPSIFAKLIEPLRWKYLDLRSYIGVLVRKFL